MRAWAQTTLGACQGVRCWSAPSSACMGRGSSARLIANTQGWGAQRIHVPSSLVRLFIILSSTPGIFNFVAGIRMIISILSS